ncbi:MAG: type IV pilus twitching motility protein PilT [Planctomycetota bacterium]|jgi:twitching motility protein PilT
MAGRPEIEKLFALMAKQNASDLHLKVGSPPVLRISRKLVSLDAPALSDDQIWTLVSGIMPEKAQRRFEQGNNADFAYSIIGTGRYRVTVLRQRGCVTVVVRRVSYEIPGYDELNLPAGARKLARFEQGLCMVVGPTGSGKSTTLAALLDEINNTRRTHILTIEDPIEYLYRDVHSLVNQREIGIDVDCFLDGLVYGLRADPDVILIGELRDFETFEIALQAAETGHLVFGTLHVSSAAQSIGRMLDLFPEGRHSQIRNLLAFNLRAVVAQILVPGATEDSPVVPAVEVMIVDPAIRKLIREAEDHKIAEVIPVQRDIGMQNFTQSLHDLVKQGLVSQEVAVEHAPNPEALQMMLRGITVRGAGILG